MKAWREEFAPRKREGDRVILERTYRLLTPLVGGGVEPLKPDPREPIRGAGLRGGLRFWWRALRGWQAEGDLGRLRELESQVFGSTDRSSPLQVEVEVLDAGQEKNLERYGRAVQWYLGFPLRQGKAWLPVRSGVRFRLRLVFPKDLEEEVGAALFGLEVFGGVGARTRRGFGALVREDKVYGEKEVQEGLRRYSRKGEWPKGVPHLRPDSLVQVVSLSWPELAQCYQAFRQSRPGGERRPGRSHWPEPDAIRRRAGRYDPKHAPRSQVDKFPRAQFGLPIVFHFKDEPPLKDWDIQLRPGDEDYDRRASPLILRPLGEKTSLVAVLEGDRLPPGGVALYVRDQRREQSWLVETSLTPDEAKDIIPLQGQTDPLRAFLTFLKNYGR